MDWKQHKNRTLHFLLILTSLLGYLEWSGNSHAFLFQAEMEVFIKLLSDPSSLLHPFIILPIIGQGLLLVTLFQTNPSKVLAYISICGLGLLLGFMFVVGLISLNYKIICSTVPFLMMVVVTVRHYRRPSVPS